MNLIQSGVTSPTNTTFPNRLYPPEGSRQSGLEFIRTVKISEANAGSTAWRVNRIDIDLPGINFTKYKEILFSFNGGFSPSGSTQPTLRPRKGGALVTNTMWYTYRDITAATPTVSYLATNGAGIIVLSAAVASTSVVQTLDIYMSPMGLRGEIHTTSDSAAVTTGMTRFNARFPAASSPDGNFPFYTDTDYPGITFYMGTLGTNYMLNPYYSTVAAGTTAYASNFECNIYGFIR